MECRHVLYTDVGSNFIKALAIILILGVVLLIPLILFWRVKVLRFVLLTIVVLLFGYLGLTEVRQRNYLRDNELRLVGTYELDTLFEGKQEVTQIRIQLQADNTFTISKSNFVLGDSVGTWKYFDNGEMAFLEFETSGSYEQVFENEQGEVLVVNGIRFSKVK